MDQIIGPVWEWGNHGYTQKIIAIVTYKKNKK